MTEKERRKKEEKLRKELETPYRKWLNEDVAYIITDEERTAFKRLQTDEEREQFIEQFWLRRDPTPDSIENEFKEEHYRRIAYANEHFASGIPGWKTDRGRIYITYGPPDENETHPSGGTYERPPEEGGGTTSTFPFETVALPLHRRHRQRHHHRIRRSHHVGRIPHDHGSVGKGRAALRPQRRPDHDGADGHVQQDRPLQPHGWHPPRRTVRGRDREDERVQPPGAVRQIAAPPAVKFKDLEAAVNSRISYNILPMKVRADFFPLTEASVLTFVTLQFDNKDLQFQAKDGVQKAVGQHLRQGHHHDAPHRDQFRGHGGSRRPPE